MFLYAATIFLSAFLLFLVEPVIAKAILPWFGGSAAVWTTCLLFFQIVLLLGYLYAHGTVRLLRPHIQARLHVGLLLLSLLVLPITPSPHWKPTGSEEPTLRILLLLLVTIGLPYFLLSSTGPLLQAWYAAHQAQTKQGRQPFPYRLYALSNTGSMLALLGYPLVVEPALRLRQQSVWWSLGYGLFVLCCSAVALRVRRGEPAEPEGQAVGGAMAEAGAIALETEKDTSPGWRDYLLWTALAAIASLLLLAVTTHLSQNVAAIPFLWVLPLSLYLLSFIVCFGGKTWEWKQSFLALPALAIGAMAYAWGSDTNELSVQTLIAVFASGLFVCCLVCHGELARLKPHPRHLTAFYLTMSLGGALGGVFVALIAPRLFRGYYELPLGIALCAVFSVFILYKDRTERWWSVSWLTLLALTGGLCYYLRTQITEAEKPYHRIVRDFYGVLSVSDSQEDNPKERTRSLIHGTIRHGDQYLSPERRDKPTTYYGPDSGVGLAVLEAQERPDMRVGVIGLGTGTLAAYGRAGDVLHFYEINPTVIQLARTEFTFLRDCKAKTEVRLGDARLTLEREPPQNYDILAVDAFSSDAIPVHLLTKEAFALYFRHLKPGGVLCVHISNRYLDLQPVVAGLTKALGKEARLVADTEDDSNDISASEWVLVTARRDLFTKKRFTHDSVTQVKTRPGLPLWTDDYSNLYQIVNTK